MWPFCNPTIEVVTFHLCGQSILLMFIILVKIKELGEIKVSY